MATTWAVTSSRARVSGYLLSYLLDRAVDGLFYLALAWLATRASGPLGAAVIVGAGSLPRVVMLVFGGAIADRLGLSVTARLTLVTRVGLLAFFAVASTGTPNGVALAVVAAAFGAVDALHMPAISGLSGLLVSGGDQVRLQGAMTSVGNAVEILAAPAAALMLAWAAPSIGWLGACLLALAALVLPRVRAQESSREDHSSDEGVLRSVRIGISYAWSSHLLRAMFAVFAAANLAATPAIGLGVPLLVQSRGAEEWVFGALMMAFAAGSVAGGLSLARWGGGIEYPARWSLLLMLPGAGGLILLAVVTSPYVGILAVAVVGACFAAGAGLLMGRIKHATPSHLMGRVMSLVQVSVYCLIPAGMLCFGALSEQWSPSLALVVAGAVMALTAFLGLVVGPLGNYRPGEAH